MRDAGRISVAAAAAVVAVVALAACSAPRTFEKPPRPVKVETATAQEGSRVSRYSAHVEAHDWVPLAFKVGGYVDTIATRHGPGGARLLQQGDVVRKGEVLARLKTEDYVARADQAKGALDQAAAGRERARLDFERASRLYDAKSLTKADFDAAKAAHQAADAQAAAAEAAAEQAQIALRDASLTAPIDALVIDRAIEAGRLVAAGTVGFTLADVRTVKVVFGVPDTIVGLLAPGQVVGVATESLPGSSFAGTISAVSPSADAQSRVFEVEVSVPNRDGRLKVGMIATVQMPDAAKNAAASGAAGPLVPLTAIVKSTKSPSGYAVFVVEGEGESETARERAVSLGGVFGNRIALLGGVKPGERAIVTGATLVADGERVRVVP